MLSINVLIITYKQHDVIGRALDSILCQKEYGLNKIILCDDCSPDNNWEVIQKYVAKYPDIICAYRNESNIGIYANAQKRILLREKADVYFRMAGDDALCNGYFKAFQNFYQGRETNILGKAVAIYSDWKTIDPNGKEYVYSNSMVSKFNDVFSLKIRGHIFNRSVFLTEELLCRFIPVDLSQGLCWAEDQFDTQTQRYSDNSLYFPFVGSIYFTGIGISNKMNTLPYYKENVIKYTNCLKYYTLDAKDRLFMKYKLSYYRFLVNYRLVDLIVCRWYHVLSIKSKYGYSFQSAFREIASMIKKAIKGR